MSQPVILFWYQSSYNQILVNILNVLNLTAISDDFLCNLIQLLYKTHFSVKYDERALSSVSEGLYLWHMLREN